MCRRSRPEYSAIAQNKAPMAIAPGRGFRTEAGSPIAAGVANATGGRRPWPPKHRHNTPKGSVYGPSIPAWLFFLDEPQTRFTVSKRTLAIVRYLTLEKAWALERTAMP